MGNNFGYPSVKAARHLNRLEEYRSYKLSQILESYRYWASSDLHNTISLNKANFDDIFGQLFNDTDVHFDSFIYQGIDSCVTMNVFYTLILLADDKMSNKVHLLFQLGKEEEVVFRVDLIQSVVFKVVSSFQLLFNVPPINKEDLHLFIDVQLTQFIERNTINTMDPALLLQRQDHEVTGLSSNATNNLLLKEMDFQDIYQWCQDVHQISRYLQALDNLDFSDLRKIAVVAKQQRTTKKLNKFFGGDSDTSGNKARRPTKNLIVPPVQKKEFAFTRESHALWSFNIQDVLVCSNLTPEQMTFDTGQLHSMPAPLSHSLNHHSSSLFSSHSMANVETATAAKGSSGGGGGGFYDEVPELTSEDCIFSALEHCVLSCNKALHVFSRDPPPPLLKATSFGESSIGLLRKQTSQNRELLAGIAALNMSNVNSPAQHTAAPSSPRYKDKFELFGIVDNFLVLEWMVQCCPALVLQQVKQDEELMRIQKKQAMDFDLSKSIALNGSQAGVNSELAGILTSIQNAVNEEESGDRHFSLASVAMPVINLRSRDKAGTTGQHGQWQETGELIANATIRQVLESCSYVSSLQQYSRQDIFTIDQLLYNVVYCFARGHSYVPVASLTYRPYKVTHVLTTTHLLRFLVAQCAEVLGPYKDCVVSTCGVMRQPVTIASKMNFGSALYKLARHHIDSLLVVDGDTQKIQCTLTTKCVSDFWFTWCQQGKKLDRSVTLADLQRQYRDHTYRVYSKTDENVSFSIFSSLLTPLMHCQAVLNIAVVNFDKFQKTGCAEPKEAHVHTHKDLTGKNMTSIAEAANYSDTDSNSDSQSESEEEASPRRKRANTASSAESDGDSDEESDEEGGKRRRKKKPVKKNSLKKKKSVVSSMMGAAARKNSSPPPKRNSTPAVEVENRAKTPTTVAASAPQQPKPSARPSATPNRRLVAKDPPQNSTVIDTANSPTTNPSTTPSPLPSPLRRTLNRATLLASASHNTKLVNLVQHQALAETSVAVETKPTGASELSINTATAPADLQRSVPGTPSALNGTPSSAGGDSARPNHFKIISHRLNKQQIAANKALAAQKKALQEESAAKARQARTLENWYRTMKLLSPGDTIETALQLMLLTDSTRAYVASPTGEPIGVVTLQDVCRELILQEAKTKQTQCDKLGKE